MKKALTILSLFLLSVTSIHADEQKKIKLDGDHSKEQVRLGYCNIFVERVDTDDGDNVKATVQIENLDESNVIIIFGHAYPEKELKKLSPSITFDKIFPGTRGKREIDTYSAARNVIFIEPSEKAMLPEIQVQSGEALVCRLPLYIARYKDKSFLKGSSGRNKLLLVEKQVVELEIEVEPKADEVFLRLETETDSLIEELSKQRFCTNSRHKPSLQRQEAPYREQVDRILHEIDSIVELRRWFVTDEGYVRYNGLKEKLKAADFTKYEQDCGRHKPITPRPIVNSGCKYCSLSPQQIYHKLDDYYKKIFSSNNRKAAKEAVMSDVNLLYGCSKHSATWKSSEYKSKIADRYNRISNF